MDISESTLVREEAERLLREKLGGGNVFMSCSGNCRQGRSLCTTPEACQLPEPNRLTGTIGEKIGSVLIWVGGILMLWGGVAALAVWFKV